MTDVVEAIGWGAAGLQVVAYAVYLRGARNGRIDPNPTSWLMWAYGTALVVVLESDQGVHPALRLLPTVCATCCITVAVHCWRRGSLRWPEERADRAALGIDLAATAVYVGVVLGAVVGTVPRGLADSGKTVLLVCLSLGTVTSYVPILRSTRRDPAAEEPMPWMVWALAYALLFAATVAAEGASLRALQFWIYPAICAVLSGRVAWHALQRGPRGRAASLGVVSGS